MSYKKHDWTKFGHSNEHLIEITLRDGSGRKLDFFRVNNNQDYKKILGVIYASYGWGTEIKLNGKPIPSKEDEMNKEELNFLKSM